MDTGERWLVSYHHRASYQQYNDRRVRVTGWNCHTNGQALRVTHFEIEHIALADARCV